MIRPRRSGVIPGGLDSRARAAAAAAVLTVLLLLLSAGAAGAQTFIDVPTGHTYYDAIEGIKAAQVIDGYPQSDGSVLFKPGNPIWRAQFAKIIVGAMQLPVDESMGSAFGDLGADDTQTLYPHEYVAAAAAAGITTGITPTTFGPYMNIKRAQVVTMVVRAVKNLMPAGTLQTPPAGWHSVVGSFDATHSPNMDIAAYNGLLDGLSGFGPGWDPYADANRGEVAQIMWNVLNPPGPAQPIMPKIADLQPAVAHYDLSLTFEGTVGVSGPPPDTIPLDRTVFTAEATVEILGVTNGVARFVISVSNMRLDGQPAGLDPVTVEFGLNGLGVITSMKIDGETVPPADLLRTSALTMFMFGSFLSPLQASLVHPGDEWTGTTDFPVEEGDGEVSSDTWVRLQSIAQEGGRRVATVEYTNDMTMDLSTQIELGGFLDGSAPLAATASTDTLTFNLVGAASEAGILKIDTETGLPVYVDADLELALDMSFSDIPADLMDAFGMLLDMGTIGVDVTGSAVLEESP